MTAFISFYTYHDSYFSQHSFILSKTIKSDYIGCFSQCFHHRFFAYHFSIISINISQHTAGQRQLTTATTATARPINNQDTDCLAIHWSNISTDSCSHSKLSHTHPAITTNPNTAEEQYTYIGQSAATTTTKSAAAQKGIVFDGM